MKWASAVSTASSLDRAAEELAEALGRELGQVEPDVVFAFAADHSPEDAARLPSALQPWLGDALLLGATASGVAGGSREAEEGPAIALLAGVAGDAEFTLTHLEQDQLPPVAGPRQAWWDLAGALPEQQPSFVLLGDPFTFDAEHCVRGLDRAFPGATVVGGLASGAEQPGQVRLLAGGDAHRAGALLLACTGNLAIEAVVSQGCRPVGEPLFVTDCADQRIRTLDGRRPREVLGDLFAALDARDRELFNARELFIGLALPGPRQVVQPGDFLVRNVLGLDADSGELYIGARVPPNGVVQFHLRDGQAAAEDLARRLAARATAAPSAALMFSCVGRGHGLYGHAGHDSAQLARACGPLPVGGFFCAGEIGPVQGATFLHGYTTVFALLSPRR
ncbi:MAG: FIST C-terminal domain-containing protein [Steroidobacteraceae bacterium]|jgi:small ligand-binding sensory domain FIST|nr:FIST C-terminal domain-containing protein [Steroidobacteraceae bacterium]